MSEKSLPWRVFIAQTAIATLLSASIIFLVVDYAIDEARFTRDWEERSLSEVVAPVVMHFDRTRRVAERYRERPISYFDAQIMRDSNEQVRTILLKNGHLIPKKLLDQAHLLVEHYDVWIRRFDEKVYRERPNQDTPFDVGFASPEFPEKAEEEFEKEYKSLLEGLYGQ